MLEVSVPDAEYSGVTEGVLTELEAIVGRPNVLRGIAVLNYSKDESPNAKPADPEVVVRPADSHSVSEILKLADRLRIPVTPRGAGTGLSGAAVPIRGGIVLSMERLNRILDIDGSNFTVTTEPGVMLKDLCQAVESKGLYYPVYPGEMTATIGGNVATNAGGMRAVKYGVTRNFVLGLEAVLASGDVVRTGGLYIKSSTAYDLTQLITGSEGTLAVITQVSLRLILPPGQRHVVLVPFEGLEAAIDTVPAILKAGILPMGIEFLEKDVVRLVEAFIGKETPIHNHAASLMIIVEAENNDDAQRVTNSIGEICLARGAIDVFVASGERASELLFFREKAWPAISQGGRADMADVVVPRKAIAEFVQRAKKVSERLGVRVYMVGHAGDGNVHISPIIPDSAEAPGRLNQFFLEIYELGTSLGGTISGEHGIGYLKKPYFVSAVGAPKLELMKRIKRAFDPNNILNPGKIFDL
jgi:glycolate oxidase